MYPTIQSSLSATVSAQSHKTALVAIDSRVDTPEVLAAGLRPNAQALLLDPSQDGITQITQALASGRYESLHLVGHGSPGQLQLGSGVLSVATLSGYRQQLLEWAVAEVLVYGCRVAAEPGLLLAVQGLTGATVAGSVLPVGRGNWELEWRSGEVQAESVFTAELESCYIGQFDLTAQLISDSNPGPADLGKYNGKVYFIQYRIGGQSSLWVSQGESSNTSEVLDLGSGFMSTFSSFDEQVSFLEIGNELFFTVQTISGDKQIWSIDSSGTAHIRIDNISGNVTELFEFNGKVYADVSSSGNTGPELWEYDLATTSNRQITDPALSDGRQFEIVGDKLYFSSGSDLWVLDANKITPHKVKENIDDIYYGVSRFTPVGDKLFFSQSNGLFAGVKLHETQGAPYSPDDPEFSTSVRTTEFSRIDRITTIGDKLFFSGKPATGAAAEKGIELWIYDTATNDYQVVRDINQTTPPNSTHTLDSSPFDLTVVGNRLFFTADDGGGRELWVVDDATGDYQTIEQRTRKLTNSAFGVSNLTVAGDKLFFVTDDGTNGAELWVSDSAGTRMVKDINDNLSDRSGYSSPYELTDIGNGKVAFGAYQPGYGTELWISDGTEAGTQLVDIHTGPGDSFPSKLTFVGGKLYVSATGVTDTGLWVIDPNGSSPTPNQAPNLILDTNAVSIVENQTTVLIGNQVSATDDNNTEGIGGGLTYAFTASGNPNNLFTINSITGALSFTNPVSYNPSGNNSYSAEIIVSDAGGLSSSSQTVIVNVQPTPTGPNVAPDLNLGPGQNQIAIFENQTSVFQFNAIDESPSTLTYAISGGIDQNVFEINNAGQLSFKVPPDFENPTDGAGLYPTNNIYDVEVTVTDDGGLTDTRFVWVKVQDVLEANSIPIINSPTNVTLLENQSTVVNVDSTDDNDSEGNGITYSISGGADASLFVINASTGELSFKTLPDYENPFNPGQQTYDVEVVATDSSGLTSAPQAIQVTIGDDLETTDPAIAGTNQRDVLFGGANDDTINGFGDNDDLHGQGGNDTLYGDDGLDQLWGGDGADRLFGGRDRDILWGGNNDDQLQGDDGNDDLHGEAGNDILRGGWGADRLWGGDNNDQLYGDNDNDVLEGQNGNDILDGGNGNDVLIGGSGSDYLIGGNDNDQLWGETGNDVLEGGAGNDVLYGQDGNDVLKGGANNDILIGGNHNDHLYGDSGDDDLNGQQGDDHLYGGDGLDQLRGEDGVDTLYGGNQRDILWGGNNNDYLYGETGDDDLYGENGNDQIFGGDGRDRLYGQDGIDELFGGANNDELWGGNQNDVLIGDAGDDLLVGESGDDELWGGANNDQLWGGTGNDRLYGDSGNDQLRGEWGDDRLEGGDGDDLLEGGDDNDILLGGNNNDQLWGGAGNDRLEGNNGNDHLRGEWGDDILEGGDGDDILEGGDQNDTLRGGNDNDQLWGGGWDDQLYGDAGDDHLRGEWGDDILEGGDGNDILEGGDQNDILRGGNNNDQLWGGGWDDQLYGDAGDDHLRGEWGEDILEGGDGNDILEGGDQNDILRGGNNDDQLWGGTWDDQLYGDAGDDHLRGEQGLDLLEGGDGDDILEGGEHNDILRGGNDNDQLWGGTWDDQLYGDAGDDHLRGEQGYDRLEGGMGADILEGGDNNDILLGGNDNDQLYGGHGDDLLNGGLGDDYLDGGISSDTYVFNINNFGADYIHGFEVGLDKIDLAHFNGSLSLGALDTNSDNVVNGDDALASMVGGNLRLDLSGVSGGQITLGGHSQIAIADFAGLT